MIRNERDMRLLHLETVTGGALGEAPLPAILADAECMRQAQLRDLAELAWQRRASSRPLQVRTLLDARLPADTAPGIETRVVPPGGFDECLRDELRHSDAVWLTAPESGDELASLSERIEAAGCRVLGSTAQAVRATASKSACAHWLACHGVASVPTVRDPRPWQALMPKLRGVVAKPDDGVGCEWQRRFDTPARAWAWGRAVLGRRAVYQPWLHGESLSLSLLCAQGRASLLGVNRQWVVERDGWLRLQAVTVNARPDPDGSLQRLGAAIARALPGLWGHVGVDLVLVDASAVVLEVNPRATLSYCGLREALQLNPARLLLELPRLPESANLRPSRSVRVELAHVAAAA